MSSSMEIEQASSSSSSSSFPSSPVIQLGGRALDRHNPIICDGRRNTTAPNTLLTPPRDFSRPPFSPQPHQLTKSKKTSSKANRKTKPKIPSVKQENEYKESSHTLPSTDILKKSSLIPTDIVTRSFAKLSDLVAPPPPPPVGSSRYLLESDTQSQFFDGLPEIDPIYDIVPADDYKELKTEVNQDQSTSSTTQAALPQVPKPTPTKQVVVLMVSLHCKGCEGKVRKHLSKMEGVTSFNIDYAAKKVTIEGDVTAVGVLASVSKLKHAKFWTSQPPTPPPPSTSLTVASTSSASTEMPENEL